MLFVPSLESLFQELYFSRLMFLCVSESGIQHAIFRSLSWGVWCGAAPVVPLPVLAAVTGRAGAGLRVRPQQLSKELRTGLNGAAEERPSNKTVSCSLPQQLLAAGPSSFYSLIVLPGGWAQATTPYIPAEKSSSSFPGCLVFCPLTYRFLVWTQVNLGWSHQGSLAFWEGLETGT